MTNRSPAIISGETVEQVARHTVRWTSLSVLLVSFTGAVMAFNGGWPTTWRVWEEVRDYRINTEPDQSVNEEGTISTNHFSNPGRRVI